MAISEMELKTRRYRAPEHEVYLYRTSATDIERMTQWCTEHYGERWSVVDNRDGRWCCFWAGTERPGHYRWCFSDERELTFFLLRWA